MIAFLSFTERGAELAERLRRALGGTAECTRHNPEFSLAAWTAEQFARKRALVYVGAVGIAVRAVAPHLRSKAADPAVVAVDERGVFAVPLASGHLGGANDLARRIAAITGGTAVITTATDRNGVFAVDAWARRQRLTVMDPGGVKAVSGKLLNGEGIRIFSRFPVAGAPPEGVACLTGEAPPEAEVFVDVFRHAGFCLVPRALALGIGCRRGTARETLEARFAALCRTRRLWPDAFFTAATIDRRGDEAGVRAFCEERGWPLRTYTAAELRRLPGAFTASAFVEQRTGVDNVCERGAVLAGRAEGGESRLLVKKYAGAGVTLAVASRCPPLDWTWTDGQA